MPAISKQWQSFFSNYLPATGLHVSEAIERQKRLPPTRRTGGEGRGEKAEERGREEGERRGGEKRDRLWWRGNRKGEETGTQKRNMINEKREK